MADETGRSRSLAYARVRRFLREVQVRIVERLLHIAGIRSMRDTYRLLTGQASDESFSDRARVELAREFILGRREPWFLHLHLVDTHCCDFGFAPPRFSSKTPPEDPRWVADRTDDALLQIDGYLSLLYADLESTGQLDRTLIVLYSDHSLGWATNERIPLIVALPGQKDAERPTVNVELIDVAPTIVEHLGLRAPSWMDGQSLLDSSRLDHARPVFGLWGAWNSPRPAALTRGAFNGAKTASLVVCNEWLEMALTDGAVVGRGVVHGHNRPCVGHDTSTAMPSILATHLRANGYPVKLPAAARPGPDASRRRDRPGPSSKRPEA